MKIKNSVVAIGVAFAGFVLSAPLLAESNTTQGTGAAGRAAATASGASGTNATSRPAEIPGTPPGGAGSGAMGASSTGSMGSSGSSGSGAAAADPLVTCKGLRGQSRTDCLRDHRTGSETTTSSNASTKVPLNTGESAARDRKPSPQ